MRIRGLDGVLQNHRPGGRMPYLKKRAYCILFCSSLLLTLSDPVYRCPGAQYQNAPEGRGRLPYPMPPEAASAVAGQGRGARQYSPG